MIDHLVEEYGVDPDGVDEMDENGCTALLCAACRGRVRTVEHLVEKYNVDIHKRTDWGGKTALDFAKWLGRTGCVAVLRGYGAKTGEELEEEASTESDDDWETDDNSDADHDVM